jgi:hypothetical protein
LSSKLSRVTRATQIWPDPLIRDNLKVLRSRGLRSCLPVSVGRRLRGAQGAGGGGADVVAAAVLGGAVAGGAVVAAATVAWAAVRLAEASGDALGLGVGEGVWAATSVGGGGEAWTAEPLLVPFAISAPITASTTTTAPTTATRRIQYV